jgi:hypothetical protein
VLDSAVCNIHRFLWRDTCASSSQLNRHIWIKLSLPPLEMPKLQEVFNCKTNSIFKANNVLHAPSSNTDGFLSRDTCVSSTQLNRPMLIT